MLCSICNKELETGAETCPHCGAVVVPTLSWGRSYTWDLTEKWPKDENGQPETACFLTHQTSVDMADDMTVNMLEAFGVPAFKCYPGNGSLGKVLLGMSGSGADIYVPVSLLEDARAIMNAEPSEEENGL